MPSIGAKIRWKEGKILHPCEMWLSPSKRRLPRLLIEDRALDVGILIYLEEPWIIFEETNQPAAQISPQEAVELELYRHRFNLLPKKIKRQDTYQWLQKLGNALLLWGTNSGYFVKASKH
jgi:hypothetical protein